MQSMNGNTGLIKACGCGHVETARILLEHGAVVDYRNKVTPNILYCCYSVTIIIIMTHRIIEGLFSFVSSKRKWLY